MNAISRAVAAHFVLACLVLTPKSDASAHPGRTDARGCHRCRTNCERWGLAYGQYHCHGDEDSDDPVVRRSGASSTDTDDVMRQVRTGGARAGDADSDDAMRQVRGTGDGRESAPPEPLRSAGGGDAATIRVGFWNLKRLGHGEKDLDVVARVLDNFDIVGIGEVMRAEAIDDLVARLGRDAWSAVLSPRAVGRSSYREFYAMIFRTAVVTSRDRGAFYADPGDRFAREPFYADFRSGNFDFTFAIEHIVWGDRASERAAEVEALADLFNSIQDEDPNEQDVILAGDFNVEPRSVAWDRLRALPGIALLLGPPCRTTLGERGFASLYDNFVIDRRFTTEFTGRASVIDTTREYRGGFVETRTRLSDHAPVWTSFRTSLADDDGL